MTNSVEHFLVSRNRHVNFVDQRRLGFESLLWGGNLTYCHVDLAIDYMW